MLEILQKCELFEGLSKDELRELCLFAKPFNYEKDEVLFAQGQEGDDIFIVHDGSIEMQLKLSLDEERKIAEFGPGQYFGEMSIFGGGIRTASAISTTRSSGLILSGKMFDFIRLVKKPGYASVLRKILISATLSLREMTKLLPTSQYLPSQTLTEIPTKTVEGSGINLKLGSTTEVSIENLKRFHLFKDFNTESMSKLLPSMQTVNLLKGELLFSQDTFGEVFYIVVSGAMQIILSSIENDNVFYTKVALIPPGRPFGHLAFFDNTPRSAGALACENVCLLRIKQNDFNELINNNSDEGFLFLYALIDDLVFSMKSTNKMLQFLSSNFETSSLTPLEKV